MKKGDVNWSVIAWLVIGLIALLVIILIISQQSDTFQMAMYRLRSII